VREETTVTLDNFVVAILNDVNGLSTDQMEVLKTYIEELPDSADKREALDRLATVEDDDDDGNFNIGF
jgi:hypothetical protein